MGGLPSQTMTVVSAACSVPDQRLFPVVAGTQMT
jgi:hypothetical protein